MALTSLQEVQGQVQEFWAPIFTKQLRENLMLGSLVSKEYEGSIKKGGDIGKRLDFSAYLDFAKIHSVHFADFGNGLF